MNECIGLQATFGHYVSLDEPPENGEMNQMTMFSRYRILNLSPGGLSLS